MISSEVLAQMPSASKVNMALYVGLSPGNCDIGKVVNKLNEAQDKLIENRALPEPLVFELIALLYHLLHDNLSLRCNLDEQLSAMFSRIIMKGPQQ
jgi:hypothetical protein